MPTSFPHGVAYECNSLNGVVFVHRQRHDERGHQILQCELSSFGPHIMGNQRIDIDTGLASGNQGGSKTASHQRENDVIHRGTVGVGDLLYRCQWHRNAGQRAIRSHWPIERAVWGSTDQHAQSVPQAKCALGCLDGMGGRMDDVVRHLDRFGHDRGGRFDGQFHIRRPSGRRPRPWPLNRCPRFEIGENCSYGDRSNSVCQRVMHLLDQPDRSVGQALDEHQLPQRMPAIERQHRHFTCQVIELRFVARGIDADHSHVVRQIEVLVIDPHRSTKSERHIMHDLT